MDEVENAWRQYVGGETVGQTEASAVWRALHDFMQAAPERIEKIITLSRWIDAEATMGKRCAVCAAVDGNHDGC